MKMATKSLFKLFGPPKGHSQTRISILILIRFYNFLATISFHNNFNWTKAPRRNTPRRKKLKNIQEKSSRTVQQNHPLTFMALLPENCSQRMTALQYASLSHWNGSIRGKRRPFRVIALSCCVNSSNQRTSGSIPSRAAYRADTFPLSRTHPLSLPLGTALSPKGKGWSVFACTQGQTDKSIAITSSPEELYPCCPGRYAAPFWIGHNWH